MFRGSEACDWDLQTPELTSCLSDHLTQERRELDLALAGYVETLGRDDARALDRAQDDWERFMEQECETAAERFGELGLEAVALLSCMVEETIRRRFQVSLMYGARTRVDFDQRNPCFVPDSDMVSMTGWVGERVYETNPVPGGNRFGAIEQQVLVVNLELPLCVDYGEGPVQVTAVQMVARNRSMSRGLARYIGQRVEVQGRLFLARSGQDRTPIMIMVSDVVPFGQER